MSAPQAENRIETLRAKVAQINASVEALESDRREAEEIERLAKQLLIGELTVSLSQKHGRRGKDWDFVVGKNAVIAVRAPSLLLWQKWSSENTLSDLETGPKTTDAALSLLFGMSGDGCLVLYPETQAEFTSAYHSDVFLLRKAAIRACNLGHSRDDDLAGK
jgi:hypothetical protein